MTSGHRVSINACQQEGEAIGWGNGPIDRYGRAEISTVKRLGAHGMLRDFARWQGNAHFPFTMSFIMDGQTKRFWDEAFCGTNIGWEIMEGKILQREAPLVHKAVLFSTDTPKRPF
ncbi:hypothetical protein TNIN_298681 [Trichonephila inaurata madagascariensis]|uniref:Uncharacterized protein n=1 Tax=Trichonephila inaurata madagascariensis TaxID=2747483 RepID=A0A8X7CCW1_9ARAC|nr:hypothetical protein TNIN_298681 [Trichonephila inaurata madagascariensis]